MSAKVWSVGFCLFLVLIGFVCQRQSDGEDSVVPVVGSSDVRDSRSRENRPEPEFLTKFQRGDNRAGLREVSAYSGDPEILWSYASEADLPATVKRAIRARAIELFLLVETPEQVAARISSLGVGLDRTSAFGTLCSSPSISPAQFVQLVGRIDLAEEKNHAAIRFGYQLSKSINLNLDDLDLLCRSSSAGKDAVLHALLSRPTALAGQPVSAIGGRVEETLDSARSLAAQGALSSANFKDVVRGIGATLPFEVFAQLSKAEDLGDNGQFLVDAMGSKRPSKLLEMARSGKVPAEYSIKSAVVGLAIADVDRAIQWVESSGGGLVLEHRDQAYGGIVTRVGSKGEFDVARNWIDKIENPNTRKIVENDLWNDERKFVRSASKESPQQLLEDIKSGESVHEEYWMKEGFKTWFSSSPDDANTWYSENERTLTPSQSQHVARAYAEVALKQGDVGLAREWADRVVDPEFKEKLVNQIEAASRKESE
jgi:hypothetical protein